MISFNRNSLAIVISDIHLGDMYCDIDKFESFLDQLLQDLKRGNLPSLETLIILGDTFDIIMNTFWNLCNSPEFIRIYDRIQAIKDNGVFIVFVLGNHEISTVGYYNRVFKIRKRDFMNEMWDNGFNADLLNDISVCQYLILGKNEQRQLSLFLYDSAHKIEYNNNGELILNDRQLDLSHYEKFNNKCYLMTHGYQFEDWSTHQFITAPWWNFFMGLNKGSKRGINEFWYGWRTEREEFDTDSFYQYLRSQGIRTTTFSRRHINQFVQNEIYRENQRFFDNAVEFLNNRGLNFVTNVIFGHIHDTLQIRDGDLLITTNGCWIQDRQTSFTEIDINGNYTLQEI
ncbi:MAG: metallophosphoesterase [Promethearchaeota archaeon]